MFIQMDNHCKEFISADSVCECLGVSILLNHDSEEEERV